MNFLRTSFLLLAIAVLMGAFGAHTLRDELSPDQLEAWKTAVFYHFIHALGMVLVSLMQAQKVLHSRVRIALQLLFAGIMLFSGSLYLLSTKDLLGIASWAWLGPLTPLGGICFVAAWLMCVFSVARNPEV